MWETMKCTFSQMLTNWFVNYAKKPDGEKICKIEASAKGYAKNVRKIPTDRIVKKMFDYLRAGDLLVIPFDKESGFCVMKKPTYREKFEEVLNLGQF